MQNDDLRPLSIKDLTELEEIVERERELANRLRVLLAWCNRLLIDEKHLIGSICKEANDVQFRTAMRLAENALRRSDGLSTREDEWKN